MITYDDLKPFAPELDAIKGGMLIADALALARRAAPCIFDPGFPDADVVKAVLRGAILRWYQQGLDNIQSESYSSQTFGHTVTFGQNNRRSLFYPTEITELQSLCGTSTRKAFMVDNMPPRPEPAGVVMFDE